MKRRTMAKRRNRMLRADRAVEKLQHGLKRLGKDVSAVPKKAWRKLERAIDLLPPFHKPHRY